MSLKILILLTNSADPDKIQSYAAFHLSLHCLLKYLFTGIQKEMVKELVHGKWHYRNHMIFNLTHCMVSLHKYIFLTVLLRLQASLTFTKVKKRKTFECKIVIIFLSIILNMSFGYSLHWFFEYPHIVQCWVKNMKNNKSCARL